MDQNSMQPTMSPEQVAFLAGDASAVTEIIETLQQSEESKKKLGALNNEIKQKEAELKQLTTQYENEKKTAVKNGLTEATAETVGVLKENQEALKDIRQKRERAKAKGMQARIDEETKVLVEQNKIWKREIRKNLKENGMPMFCDSKAFFIMFSPNSAVEWMIRMAVFAFSLLVVPTVILWLADPWWLWKILWFIVIDILFLGIYMTMFLMSKDKDVDTLEKIREVREDIADADKKIRAIKNAIKSDTDESQYNLGGFDAQIESITATIEEATARKEAQVKAFEELTKPKILKELADQRQPVIDNAAKALDEMKDEWKQWNEKNAAYNQTISQVYVPYLGKNFVSVNQLEIIKNMIETGQTENIGSARDLLASGYQPQVVQPAQTEDTLPKIKEEETSEEQNVTEEVKIDLSK